VDCSGHLNQRGNDLRPRWDRVVDLDVPVLGVELVDAVHNRGRIHLLGLVVLERALGGSEVALNLADFFREVVGSDPNPLWEEVAAATNFHSGRRKGTR
jgi:hypothetical protein